MFGVFFWNPIINQFMQNQKGIVFVLVTLALSFLVMSAPSQENVSGDSLYQFFVLEQKIFLINRTTVAVYSGQESNFRLAQDIVPPQFPITEVQVFSSSLIALKDQHNLLYIYRDNGNGFQLEKKESFPPNSVIDLADEQNFVMLGENRRLQSHVRLMKTENAHMEEISQVPSKQNIRLVKLCPDNTAIAQFQSSIHIYDRKNNLLEVKTKIHLNDKVEDLIINYDCSSMALFYHNLHGKIQIFNKVDGQFSSERQDINLATEFHPKIIFDLEGKNLVVQAEHDLLVYHKIQNADLFILQKVIYRRHRENLLGIQDKTIFLKQNQNLYTLSLETEERKSLSLEGKQKPRIERNLAQQPTSNFGGKVSFTYESQSTLTEARREILDIKVAGDLMVASSKYKNALIYQKSGDSYIWTKNLTETIFLEDIDAETGQVAIAAHKYAYIYEGPNFDLSQTIQTESQVRRVDLTIGWLLLGHANGTISIYNSNEGTYEWQNQINHEGGSIYGVRKCSDGNIITIVEEGGAFSVRIYDDNLERKYLFEMDELIEVFMDITDDCQTIAVSGITMKEVLVYRHYGSIFYFFEGIEDDAPLGPVSIHNDGDLILVPRLTTKEALFYRYVSCGGYFVLDNTFTSTTDYFSTSALGSDTIILGLENGEIMVEKYGWQVAGSVDFGGKGDLVITEYTTVSLPRFVKGLALSGNYLAVNVEYTNGYLFKNNGTKFTELNNEVSESIFLSDVDVADLINFMVLGSHDTRTFIFSNKGMGYDLCQTINSDSQVQGVDLSPDGTLLLGHKNGNLTFYRYDSTEFTYVASMIHSESSILNTIICPNSLMLALVEMNGLFYIKTYQVGAQFNADQTIFLQNQFMKPFFSATDDCKLVAVSGTMMMGAEIYQQQDDLSYVKYKTIDDGDLLADISIEKDGDLIMVSRLLSKESILYKYSKCDGQYSKAATLSSSNYDVASDINCQFIVQGNERGGLKISQYTYEAVVCPS